MSNGVGGGLSLWGRDSIVVLVTLRSSLPRSVIHFMRFPDPSRGMIRTVLFDNGSVLSVGTNIGKYKSCANGRCSLTAVATIRYVHVSAVNDYLYIVIQSGYRISSLHMQSNVAKVNFVSGGALTMNITESRV